MAEGITAYQNGDYKRAFHIWHAMAKAGKASAQFHLGALYFEGRGVEKDLKSARAWLEKAKANGDKRAVSIIKQLIAARSQDARLAADPRT